MYVLISLAFDPRLNKRYASGISPGSASGSLPGHNKCVRNWLQHRTQRVMVDGTLSEQGIVGSGVPQGLVLGPLRFLIYKNDLD